MPMPVISPEVIASIREQTNRYNECNFGDPYCITALRDITEENPELAEAIIGTIKNISERFNIDMTTQEGFTLVVNIFSLASSVYMSIKQQMICDELNG